MDKKIKVVVRWWDGYLETFEATEVRHGAYLLWIDLGETNRHIPLEKVRWFSVNPSSRE
ncbi:hypothetical protein ES703_87976 [subsurface metagenome]